MEWLSEWIKQIVLLVLIATFIDLLLPNQSFDRYVKLVLGLLIIMAILTPILQLINQDIDFTSWKGWKTDQAVYSVDSIQTIQEKSRKLQEYQTKQIQKQWEQNMEKRIKEELTKQFALHHINVLVKTSVIEGKTPHIQSIDVQAQTGENRKKNQSNMPSSIEPIDSIQVELHEHKEEESKGHPLTEKIKKYIINHWNLQSEQVKVKVETGA